MNRQKMYAKTHELQAYSQQLLTSNLNLQAEGTRKILSMYGAYSPKNKIKNPQSAVVVTLFKCINVI